MSDPGTPYNNPAMQGILGNANMPQMQNWQTALGALGASMKDASAYMGNRPENATNVAAYGQQMQQYNANAAKQRAVSAMSSTDPTMRQQGYQAAMALGMDPSPFMKMQSNQGMIKAAQGLPGSDLLASMSPEAQADMAQGIVSQGIKAKESQYVDATPQEKVAGGYLPNDPVKKDPLTGQLVSPVKPKAALDQDNYQRAHQAQTPQELAELAIQRQQLAQNNVGLMQPGETPFNKTTGQPMGGAVGTMPTMQNGKLSNNLSDYPANMQPIIQAMIAGKEPAPQGAALKSPQVMNLIAAAHAIDPSFDATTWGARSKMAQSEAAGDISKTINGFGTFAQHGLDLQAKIPTVASRAFPLYNWASNHLGNAFGAPGVDAWNDNAMKFVQEGGKLYSGGTAAEGEVNKGLEALGVNGSSSQKQSVIKSDAKLAWGKMNETVQQYNRVMGTNRKPTSFMSPQSAAAFTQLGIDPDTGEEVSAKANTPAPDANIPQGQPGAVPRMSVAAAGVTAKGPNGTTLTSDGKGGWH